MIVLTVRQLYCKFGLPAKNRLPHIVSPIIDGHIYSMHFIMEPQCSDSSHMTWTQVINLTSDSTWQDHKGLAT